MIILDAQADEIKNLVDDLGWDYDRMSTSGKETYNKLCVVLKIEPMEEAE